MRPILEKECHHIGTPITRCIDQGRETSLPLRIYGHPSLGEQRGHRDIALCGRQMHRHCHRVYSTP